MRIDGRRYKVRFVVPLPCLSWILQNPDVGVPKADAYQTRFLELRMQLRDVGFSVNHPLFLRRDLRRPLCSHHPPRDPR